MDKMALTIWTKWRLLTENVPLSTVLLGSISVVVITTLRPLKYDS